MTLYKRNGSSNFYSTIGTAKNRKRISTGFSNEREAKLFELLHELTSKSVDETSSLTLGELVDRYSDNHSVHLSSHDSTKHLLKKLKQSLGSMMVCDLSNQRISDFVIGLRKNVAPATVNRHIQFLRAVLRRAQNAWGVTVPEIDWGSHTLKEPPARDRWLTDQEIERLLEQSADHLKPLIVFTLLTGVRKNNCLDLDWESVDLENNVISLVVKGGKKQLITISEKLRELLLSLKPQNKGAVFLRDGKPVRSVRTAFQSACRRAGINDFVWHDLRHHFATTMRRSGADLTLIKEALGHQNIETTLRYAHHSRDELAQAVNRVAETLPGDCFGQAKSFAESI